MITLICEIDQFQLVFYTAGEDAALNAVLRRRRGLEQGQQDTAHELGHAAVIALQVMVPGGCLLGTPGPGQGGVVLIDEDMDAAGVNAVQPEGKVRQDIRQDACLALPVLPGQDLGVTIQPAALMA